MVIEYSKSVPELYILRKVKKEFEFEEIVEYTKRNKIKGGFYDKYGIFHKRPKMYKKRLPLSDSDYYDNLVYNKKLCLDLLKQGILVRDICKKLGYSVGSNDLIYRWRREFIERDLI